MSSLPEYPPRIARNEAAANKFLLEQKQYNHSCFSNWLDAQEEDKRNNYEKTLPK